MGSQGGGTQGDPFSPSQVPRLPKWVGEPDYFPPHILNCPHQPNLFQEMVSVIDQDGDGDISFNEFVWLMTK